MAIAHGLAEDTSMDWSATQVSDAAGVTTALGLLGLVAVTVCMFATRVSGDLLVARFGRRPVIVAGGAVAAAGYLILPPPRRPATSSSPPPRRPGAASRLGACRRRGRHAVAPDLRSGRAHGGGRGLAVVLTFDDALLLVRPAIGGSLVQVSDLSRAMLLPGGLSLGLFALAAAVHRNALPSGRR